jgi:hypothetical protein
MNRLPCENIKAKPVQLCFYIQYMNTVVIYPVRVGARVVTVVTVVAAAAVVAAPVPFAEPDVFLHVMDDDSAFSSYSELVCENAFFYVYDVPYVYRDDACAPDAICVLVQLHQ